jgi:L-xylulokinase
VERDATALFMANARCIKAVIEKSGVEPKLIKAVSMTGYGNGLQLVGKDGRPSYNAIISTDTRAARHVDEWYSNGVFEKLLPITNQNIWAGQLSPLLAWFRDNKGDVLDRSRYAFSVTDYVRWCLTGEAYGEITNMSAINLMNHQTKEYDDEALRLLGLGDYKHLLPPIRYSHDICGGITEEAARLTGLISGTPVVGGMVDFSACPLATGVSDGDKLSLTTGTWVITSYISKQAISDRDLLMTSLYPIDGYYLIMEGSMTSASNLEWYVQKMMPRETADAAKSGESIYQKCNQMVSSLPPEEAPVVFLPYLYGTNVNAEAKACFFGLNYSHGRAHIVRAIYEGVVFSAMMHIEKLLNFRSEKPTVVRISGGASRSTEWVQMFADALQTPIEVSGAKELGTMGAAMCAAVGVGEFKTYEDAMEKFVRIKYTCEPNPSRKEIYEKKYALYKRLVQNMDGLWSEWSRIY